MALDKTTARMLNGARLLLAFVAMMQFSFLGPLAGSAQAVDKKSGEVQTATDPDGTVDAIPTATPIKHVIIIVGENRSFDHLFATYEPKSKSEKVSNLLSEGIVNADGTPGPNFAKAHQFAIVAAPNAGKFFSSADMAQKQLYATLPPPDVDGVGSVSPYAAVSSIPGGDPGLPAADQFLLGTGGTGLSFTLGPDVRITDVNGLPPGPVQLA